MGLFKRNKVWWMSFAYHGRQVRRTTGTTDRRLAEGILGKVKVKLIEGEHFDVLEEQERTVAEMLERYAQERALRGNAVGVRRDRGVLKHLLPVFGSTVLAQVSPKSIAAYRTQRQLEKAKPATIVKELGLLKAAFNVAIREWEWCRDNPVRRVSMGRVNNARVRYVDDVTLERIGFACPAWLRPIVVVARYTGMRRENLVTLTWSHVDLTRRVVVLEHTKNGDRLGIPLCEPAAKVLEALGRGKRGSDGRVFVSADGEPITGDAVGMAFARACRQAGVTDFRFHDLRHTFASMLVQRGVDLYRVQRLLGHRDGRMTQRYAHLAPENLRDAVQVFNGDYHKFSTRPEIGSQAVGLSR